MSGGTHELKGKSVEVKTAAPRDGPRHFNGGGGGFNGGGYGGGGGGYGGGYGGGGGGYGGQQGWSQQVSLWQCMSMVDRSLVYVQFSMVDGWVTRARKGLFVSTHVPVSLDKAVLPCAAEHVHKADSNKPKRQNSVH